MTEEEKDNHIKHLEEKLMYVYSRLDDIVDEIQDLTHTIEKTTNLG